ncbi:MAG: hypothetical protein LAP85_03680 [Acidobacteriia bacterium]|nr:hypothetical protein [Terriglobia bacterium]
MPALVLLLASLLCWTVPDLPVQKRPVFATASFLGKNRMFLEDLNRDEVRIFENGRPREVEFFSGPEVPTAYGLLFDRAILPLPFDDARRDQVGIPSSMAATNVAYQLIDQGLANQIGWVGTYDKEMRVALDFSPDTGRIKDVIQQLRAQRSTEESFLYGTLLEAVKKMVQRNEKRRVLIVFLDFLDTGTGARLKPLKNLLTASNVELFIASFASRTNAGLGLPPPQSEASLRELAAVTAGGAYFSTMEGIEGLGRRISNQIRTFYTIGFQSESASDQPAPLRIECTRPGVKVMAHPVVPNLQ